MAEAAPAPAPAPAKKGPLLMIVIALIFAVATGGGVYFAMAKTQHAQGAGADKEKAEEAPKLPAQYVKLDPPFVVNFEAKGLMRFLQVSIEIMTRDSVTLETIRRNDPMIRNDLILLFGNQKYETISSREGKDQLRAEALKVVAKVVADEGGSPEKVEQLYFTSFVMQ